MARTAVELCMATVALARLVVDLKAALLAARARARGPDQTGPACARLNWHAGRCGGAPGARYNHQLQSSGPSPSLARR